MHGGGKKIRFHNAGHALRVEEDETIEEFDFIGGADAFVKVFQIGAAAERDVLAVVHMFAIRQGIGSRAAAEIGSLFEEANAAARVSQRDAGRQARQPAANHDHVFRGHYLDCAARILRGR